MFGSLATLTDDGVASPHILNKEDPTVEEWGCPFCDPQTF